MTASSDGTAPTDLPAESRWRDPLGPGGERPLDRIVALARTALAVPMAGVGRMDDRIERFLAREGDLPQAVPRMDSLCDICFHLDAPLAIEDARADPRTAHLPSVRDVPHIRGFLAVPIPDLPDMDATICAADTAPRRFGERDVATLTGLARLASGEMTLRRMALSDALTGLMSRGAWEEAAARAAALAARGGAWSVLLVDLDGLKSINDTHGHAAGDAALREVGRRLTALVRAGEAAGRIGGDEMAVLIQGDPFVAQRAAHRLAASLTTAHARLGDLRIPLSVSMGWARLRGDLAATLEAADAALYRAKAGRRAA